ncbi:MAG: hypothetical protein U0R44_06675 [Candidatus Micrarchaeia archaeon]
MFMRVQSNPSHRPKRGISAEVLIDGFSPGPAKDLFQIGPEFALVASYLLEGDRGFFRVRNAIQPGATEPVTLLSEPHGINQHRVAFGLTLLDDARQMSGRMGLKLILEARTVSRFVQAREPIPCIKFLEALEGVDDLLIRFRYRDKKMNTVVKGTLAF